MQNFILLSVLLVMLLGDKGSCEDNPELENPCDDQPVPGGCDGFGGLKRYFYHKSSRTCVGTKCDVEGGFSDMESCKSECEKQRRVRKISMDNKFGVLADFEITAPKKLGLTTKRRFPLGLCELEWDSGLICPGIRRGSYLDQFHYDPKLNTCEHFIYNGCGGNANRFFTLWECIQSCVKKSYFANRL